MKIKKYAALLLAAIMLLCCVAGCANNDTPPADDNKVENNDAANNNVPNNNVADDKNDKPVVIYSPAVFTSLNPLCSKGYGDKYIATNVYQALTITGKTGVDLLLAESYEISDDGLVYTFKLPQNVKFHNGDALKASDVVWSLNVYAREFTQVNKYTKNIKDVRAIDETTIEIEINSPYPLFLNDLTNLVIFNQAFVEASEDREIRMVECGTGPYKVVEFNGTDKCKVEAFADYYEGEPAIKDVEFRYISDQASAAVAFESGDITIMEAPIAQGKIMVESGKYNSQVTTPPHTAIIAFNCSKAPFDNKLVRQAFSYAADKETIIQIAYEGMAKVARIHADPDTVAGVDMSKAADISYNPEKAKELLAQAGYPNGLNLTEMGISFKTIAGGYHEKIAQVYQQNLAAIGVTVELISTETPDEDVVAGDFYIMNEGLGFQPDFAFNINQYSTSAIGASNMGHWSDEWCDKEYERINAIVDPEVRLASYADLIAYIVDACPTLPIMHKNSLYVFDKDLNAFLYDSNSGQYRVWEWSWN